ncbi:MAG: ATP synthase F1 subunit delta [Bacteroidales bacterium]
MNSGRVAIRYAKGFLKFGNQNEISDRLYADTLTLIHTLKESVPLVELMENPSVPFGQKEVVLRNVLSNSIHPSTLNFLNMMVKRGRFEYLLNSLFLFRDLYRKQNSIVEAQVESAENLGNEELQGIERLISSKFNKKTELSVTVKPELIAGFIVIVEGKILNFSVSGQLLQFKKSLGLTLL